MKYSDGIPELPARVSKQTPEARLAVPETSSERKTSVKNRKDFSSGTTGERMNPHVQQETALIWTGGGRRYFTRKAALRGAAKKIIRDYLRGTGDEMPDIVTWAAWMTQLVGKIERGERPELDPDDAAPMPHEGKLRDDPIPSTPPPPVMGGSK